MTERLEQIALLATASLSILITLADFLGLLDSVEWLSNRIPTLVLLLVGVVAGYLALERRSKLDKIDHRLETLEDSYSRTNAFFSAIRQGDHFSEISLIYGLRAYGRLLSEGTVTVDRSQVLNLWRDCMAGSKRWLALSYARKEDTWDLGWGDAMALGIQRERILLGGTIKRVFIVDDEQEFELLKGEMESQLGVGVAVSWLSCDDLLQSQLISENVEALGTLDFVLADDSYVVRIFLDEERRYTHATATTDEQIRTHAAFVFNEAWRRGRLLSE